MDIIYTILLIVFLIILVYYAVRSFGRRKIQKEKLFPEEWREILLDSVLFYLNLEEADRKQFEQDVLRFLDKTRITGIDTTIADTDRLLVASAAVIPVFSFHGWNYSFLKEVILYPGAFNRNHETAGDDRSILGMVGDGYLQGKMILSKKVLHKGFENENDKKNVGIHEFIHLLDKEDGVIDGIPSRLLEKQYTIPWLDLIRKKTDEILADRSDINPYATTNQAEFFSVVSEYFFERPKLLKKKHPELYQSLEIIFDQKLAQKHQKRLRKMQPGRNDPCDCGSGRKYKHCCGKG